MNPIDTALLARLLVPARKAPSELEVLRSLRPFFGDGREADDKLRAGLERLAATGLREHDEMTLTARGQKRAADMFGVKHGAKGTKGKVTWPRLKASLVALALGRSPAERERPLGAGAIRAAALASKLGLETKSTRPAEVLDAWAARELGMRGGRLTVANVRAHVLARALGIEALRDPKRIGTVATAHVLGVPRTDAGLVRDAVLRDWLCAPVTQAAESSSRDLEREGAREGARMGLSSFATAVSEIARGAEEGRFGRHKVFIGPIWRHASASSSFGGMNEREFKAKLVDAHRAGLLRLARADLTSAMAPDVVEASEVQYLNAVFHFVDLEGTLS